jgi:hypothetical protein
MAKSHLRRGTWPGDPGVGDVRLPCCRTIDAPSHPGDCLLGAMLASLRQNAGIGATLTEKQWDAVNEAENAFKNGDSCTVPARWRTRVREMGDELIRACMAKDVSRGVIDKTLLHGQSLVQYLPDAEGVHQCAIGFEQVCFQSLIRIARYFG